MLRSALDNVTSLLARRDQRAVVMWSIKYSLEETE